MGDVYELLLHDSDNRPEMIRLFYWILFAFQPITLEQLQQALQNDVEHQRLPLSELPKTDICDDTVDDMTNFVVYLSKGLVEVRTEGKRQVPQFIHQSVPEYLLEKGMLFLCGTMTGSVRGFGHYYLARNCIKNLSLPQIRDAATAQSRIRHKTTIIHRMYPTTMRSPSTPVISGNIMSL